MVLLRAAAFIGYAWQRAQDINICNSGLWHVRLASGNLCSVLSADVLDVKVGCTGNVVSMVQVLAALTTGMTQTRWLLLRPLLSTYLQGLLTIFFLDLTTSRFSILRGDFRSYHRTMRGVEAGAGHSCILRPLDSGQPYPRQTDEYALTSGILEHVVLCFPQVACYLEYCDSPFGVIRFDVPFQTAVTSSTS